MPIETHENCAVLFADMSGSTKLYLTVGDDRAREIVAQTLGRWSQLTVADGGQVIQFAATACSARFRPSMRHSVRPWPCATCRTSPRYRCTQASTPGRAA